MDVLYEKCSMSNVTFLISLCKDFNSSAVGSASVTCRVSVLPKNKPQSFFKKRCTPSIPFVSQGLDCSNGPRNISYKRRVSAPYFSTIISGFTTLNMDLDIFSTAHPQIYLPSSNTNSASIVRYDIYVYMDRGDLLLVFQVQGNEFIGSVDAVHEVRPSLDHTLVDQFLERLFLANDTQVE